MLRRPSLLLVTALALCRSATHALTIDVTPVHRLHAAAPSTDAAHASLEQRWTVASSSVGGDTVRALRIDALCHVTVSYEPEPPQNKTRTADPVPVRVPLLATVRVTGSDFQLITQADVVAADTGTLVIRLLDAVHLDKVDGFVGIHVVLHQLQKLQRLTTVGDGDVVVTNNVLVEHEPLGEIVVAAHGTGAVYLPSQLHFMATTISLEAHDAASVYLPTASTLNATRVSFLQSGSGTIAATSAVLDVDRTITVAANGTGSVCIDATFVATNVITVHASSAGDVYVGSHDGTWDETHRYFCDAAQVDQRGAGNVDLGTVLCIDTSVELYGSGNVTVASARSLGGHAYGAGKILYAGDSPVDVLDVDPWAFLKVPIAQPATDYRPRTCTVRSAPPSTLTRIEGRASGAHPLVTPGRVGVVALLVLCVGVAYVAETRRQRLVRREEATPLLRRRHDATPASASL